MSESSAHQNANEFAASEEAGIVEQTPGESYEPGEGDLPRYRVELESVDEGIRRAESVHAGSMEEALAKVRDVDQWRPSSGSGSDPGRFRVVEVVEESAAGEAIQQRNARRRYLNTIVEAGLTALGKTVPDRSDDEFSDVLCDFFSRAVVWPEHLAFPSGDTEAGGLLKPNDSAGVMAQLLTAHLAHHGLKVSRTLPE
jgi:hypothetical protein